ncbi:Sec-independent protein translocase protein TatB [Amphritea sp.]|uniref:Sec-independent protein translocase protein TatB n=1 Tax=Amphritea sp. TaxID=1872502 RepID=UPI003A8CDA51
MFDIGFAELLIIAVVGLVVLGPEKLPVAVRTVGLWVSKAKRTLSGIQSEISEELRLDEMRRQVAIQKDELDRELNEMRTPSSAESVAHQSSKADSAPSLDSSPNQAENEPNIEVAPEQEKTKAND